MPRRASRSAVSLLAGALLWFGVACVVLANAAEAHSRQLLFEPVARERELYLLPITVCGPNNQKRDIRNYYAMAKELGAKLVLTGLFRHHTDMGSRLRAVEHAMSLTPEGALPSCFESNKIGFLPFDQVLDRSSLDQEYVVTLDELRQDGWDGQLDAIVHQDTPHGADFQHLYVQRAFNAMNISLPESAARIPTERKLECDPERLAALRAQLQPYRYVVVNEVLLGSAMKPNLRELARLDSSTLSECERELHEGARLRAAPWIQEAARRLVETKLGEGPYTALHVRPYPDVCLKAWQSRAFVPGRPLPACPKAHLLLHDRLPKCVRKVASQVGTSKVFVMTHPMIMDVVHELINRGSDQDGDTPLQLVSLSYKDLQTVGCKDFTPTFFSMLEEEISIQASWFLGSEYSSVSQTIALVRIVSGNADKIVYLEDMQC